MTRRGFFASLFAAAASFAAALPKPLQVRKPLRYVVSEPPPYHCQPFSLRVISQYNAASDRYITRLDVLYGIAPIKPQIWGVCTLAPASAIDPGSS